MICVPKTDTSHPTVIERKSSNANCASRRATLQRGADYVPLILTKKSRLVIITLLKQRLLLKPNCGTLVSYPIHLQPQLPKEGGGQGGLRGYLQHTPLGPPLEGAQPMDGKSLTYPTYALTRRQGSMSRGTYRVSVTWTLQSS